MAVINAGNPTLLDQIKRTDPQGNIVSVVELLQRRNPMLEDITFQEGNLTTGHRFSSRTGLPSVGWRRFNEGVSPSKSAVDNIDESCGMLEGMSVVDTALADLNGNAAAFRASEDSAFLQAFNNEVTTGLFYHSTKSTPEKFMGLSPRFDATTGASQSLAASQIIKAGGSGADNTSMWFVCWSPDSVFGIYPKGSQAGLQSEDLGKQLWDDLSSTGAAQGYQGKKFTAWVTKWNWKIGLVVKDFRQVVRIANIDISDALAGTGTQNTQQLLGNMIDAYYQMNEPMAGRTVIYCNRQIGAALHKMAMAKTSSQLTLAEYNGRIITMFLGLPIRVTDALNSVEGLVP
jgi:hypothetical protein